MKRDEALRVAQSMTYKPGWEIEVTDRGDGQIGFFYEYWAPNSTPPGHSDNRLRVVADGRFEVDYGRAANAGALQRMILEGFLGAEMHEVREFLRFDGVAPFHPHRYDGRAAFMATQYLATHPIGI